MIDDLLTEEEKEQLNKQNEEMIAALQKQGIKMGRVRVHVTPDRTLIVKVRGDRPGESEEYMFFPNGKFFEKVR